MMGCDMSGIAVGCAGGLCCGNPGDIKTAAEEARHRMAGSRPVLGSACRRPVSAMKTPDDGRGHQADARDRQRNVARQSGRHGRLAPAIEGGAEDDTPAEAAAGMMHGHHRRGGSGNPEGQPERRAAEQDELSGWFGTMDKYSGARGARRIGHSGCRPTTAARTPSTASRAGTCHIDNLSVSILGGIQPEPIRKLADGGEDDGLLQRFIPIVLRPAVGGRDEAPGQAVFDYTDLIKQPARPQAAERGHPATADPLKFDDGALKIREELERKHLDLMKLEGINRKLTSHFGKYNGIFARLCVVWHCVEHVGGHSCRCRHGGYGTARCELPARLPAAARGGVLYGVLGLANDHDRLANVADYILAHKLERITNRDIQRGDRSMRDLKRRETEAIFEQLDALGWVTRTRGLAFRPAALDRQSVVHQKFAARAEAAKKRRERDREVIDDLLKGARRDDGASQGTW